MSRKRGVGNGRAYQRQVEKVKHEQMTGNEKQNIVWELSQEHRLSSVGGRKWWKTAMIVFAACVGCWRGGGSRRMREGLHAVSSVDKPPYPHAGHPVDGWRWRSCYSPLFAFVVSDSLPVRPRWR